MFDNIYLFIMSIALVVATILTCIIGLITYRGRGRFFICLVDHVFILASLGALFLILHPQYFPHLISIFG